MPISGDDIHFSTGVLGRNIAYTVYVRKHYKRIYNIIFNSGNDYPESDGEDASEDESTSIAAPPTSQRYRDSQQSYILTGTPGE